MNFDKNQIVNRYTLAKKYEYTIQDGDYIFMAPRTLEELINESNHQMVRCLTLIGRDQKRCIIFMRNKNTPEKSEVTILIEDGQVLMACQAHYNNLNRKQKHSVSEWCSKFNLKFNHK